MTDDSQHDITQALQSIASSLQRMAPPLPSIDDFTPHIPSYIWQNYDGRMLHPIPNMPFQALSELRGVESQKATLLENTFSFAQGHRANNALLWGARGMGKSSLVKSVFMHVQQKAPIILIELPVEELPTLGTLISFLRGVKARFIIFCDDLSFSGHENDYRSLKSSLDGGLRGWPENVLIYATSNRRHLMARSMKENDIEEEIHPSETAEEKISLSDRFGLWIGFYSCEQPLYDDIILNYAKALNITLPKDVLLSKAHQWALSRGGRSGRVAQQFLTSLKNDV